MFLIKFIFRYLDQPIFIYEGLIESFMFNLCIVFFPIITFKSKYDKRKENKKLISREKLEAYLPNARCNKKLNPT